jgi:hypothetical protein
MISKKKRREYKRKWMANARLRSKHFVAVSSSEEECETIKTAFNSLILFYGYIAHAF